MKKITYPAKGMHCSSCELLIEEKLIAIPEVEAVDASTSKNQVTLYYKDRKPSLKQINKMLKQDGYCLCAEDQTAGENKSSKKELVLSLAIAVVVFFGFLLLNRLGLSSLVNVSTSSSLPAFFAFGLLAGVSTCAALTGGIVLSTSNQWLKGYAKDDSLGEKMKPHILFNIGRLVVFLLFGALLGALGNTFQLSVSLSAMLVIAVSVFMFLTGLKMLGVKALSGFQIALPKSLTQKAVSQKNFQGKLMPLVTGALTILLPCGFTITTESLALLSGNFLQGALIMGAFAIGTMPGLLGIGFSAVKMGSSNKSAIFSKMAGALVLLFALFNLNSQFNVLGLPSLDNLNVRAANSQAGSSASLEGLAPIVEGKQLLKMEASSYEYSPNYFKVKAGVPVRWEITDIGTSGCTNAVISQSLFEGEIPLTPGEVSVKEFTPTQAGKYKFSCWMGMVSGVIEVVDETGGSVESRTKTTQEVSSGAQGCGCGGGSGSCSMNRR